MDFSNVIKLNIPSEEKVDAEYYGDITVVRPVFLINVKKHNTKDLVNQLKNNYNNIKQGIHMHNSQFVKYDNLQNEVINLQNECNKWDSKVKKLDKQGFEPNTHIKNKLSNLHDNLLTKQTKYHNFQNNHKKSIEKYNKLKELLNNDNQLLNQGLLLMKSVFINALRYLKEIPKWEDLIKVSGGQVLLYSWLLQNEYINLEEHTKNFISIDNFDDYLFSNEQLINDVELKSSELHFDLPKD